MSHMPTTMYIIRHVQERLGAYCHVERNMFHNSYAIKYKDMQYEVKCREYDNIPDYQITPTINKIVKYLDSPPTEYAFVGPYAKFGVSLANIMRKKPCGTAVRSMVDEMISKNIQVHHVFTDMDEFLSFETVLSNINWLRENRVITKLIPKKMCPWDTSIELDDKRHGYRWSAEEKSWVQKEFHEVIPKGQIQEMVRRLAEQTNRTENAMAIFIKDHCIL